MEKEKLGLGQIVKKKFYIAMFSGLFAFFGMIATFGFTGTAFALPLGGIGDFYVEFDELNGTNFQLLPHIGETGDSDAAPMVRNQMDSATIQGLHIYKDLQIPVTGQWVRFHIIAEGNTQIQGLTQDARFIDANLSFEELNIKESNTSDFSQNWTQNAKTIKITDAQLVTDYLFQSVVSLESAKISVEFIDGPHLLEE